MNHVALLAALIAGALPVAVSAQSQSAYPGQDTSNPRSNAIAAQTAPGVAAANDAVAPRAQAQVAVSALDQTGYAADVAAYDAARRARRQAIRHDRAYYDRQQRAYAQAMADWRGQVAACRRGDNRACNLPAPRPGDYM